MANAESTLHKGDDVTLIIGDARHGTPGDAGMTARAWQRSAAGGRGAPGRAAPRPPGAVAPLRRTAELERSDPLDGAVVPVGRTTLTLWFGESVATPSSSFVLRTQDGSIVPTTASGPRDTTVIEIGTDPLKRDTYQLDWRVFSLDDGHTTSGTLVFGAGVRPATPTSSDAQIPPLRWSL